MKRLQTFLFLFFPSIALASPWTLPQGKTTASLGFEYQFAVDEHLSNGTLQSFPLRGRFQQTALNIGLRYGFTDQFEGAVDFGLKSVGYKADPVVLGLPEERVNLEGARAAVFDFSRSAQGAGDVWLSARYNLLRGRLMLTNETRAKFPTGYKAPEQTFADPNNPTPTNIQDDVSLGDAQTDIENSLLVGTFFPSWKVFLRAGAGLRFRFGAPGHQAMADVKVGKFVGDQIILFGGARGALTLLEGDVIGTSFVINRESATSRDISPDDIDRAELRLDRDFLQVEGGLIWVLKDVEFVLAYSYLPVGRNIPAVHGLFAGTTVRLGSPGK